MPELTGGIVETKEMDIQQETREGAHENYASDKEISEAVKAFVDEKIKTRISQLEPYWDEMVHYDYMWRCGKSAAQRALNKKMAQIEETKSDVGATMFFRQVAQSAAKTYSLQASRDKYWEYVPVHNPGIPYSKEEGESQASQLNVLCQWSLDKDRFDTKLIQIDTLVPKYGILFVGVNWVRKQGRRTYTIPGGEGQEAQTVEIDTIIENRPVITVYDPFSVIADPNIDSIQEQECLGVTGVISFAEALRMVQEGYWDLEAFQTLGPNQQWDGRAGRPKADDISLNTDITVLASDKTASLLKWDCWVMLPIGEDGSMDEKKNIPVRYRCTFLGNSIGDSVCVRIERNDDPDDEIPIEAIHDYPDDPGKLFHISKGSILKNNYAVEVTAVNQMVDGVTLALEPPMIERKGALLKFPGWGRSKRVVVRDDPERDIKVMAIPDRTQTGLALLGYVKDDSKMAIHTDPSQMGEGLGSRASATEASGVMKMSAAPSVMNSKYITEQLFVFLAKKIKSYWQNFGMTEQVIQITDDEGPLQTIKPAEITGEFDVRVDVVDRMVDDIMGEQRLSQDIQMILGAPQLAEVVDIEELLKEYFIIRYGKSYVQPHMDADATAAARKENRMIAAGEVIRPEDGQNHKVHLKEHRAERMRYRGVEEQFPAVAILDQMIEGHMQMMEGGVAAEGGMPDTGGMPEGPEAAMGGAANMPAIPGGL